MKMLAKLFHYTGYVLFRPVWWLERLVPRSKDIWVFGAWYGQKYSDNSKWLYEYVLSHEPQIQAIWITKNRAVYEKLRAQEKPVCMSASVSGAWWCLRAKYALLTSGVVDVNKFFLNGCRQVWLWHGMPLKKIGFCDDSFRFTSSKLYLWLWRIISPYSYLSPYCTLTSSDFFTPFLKEAFQLSEERIWRTGLPRCDAFFANKTETFLEKLRSKYIGVQIFLYMPTFRLTEKSGRAFSPFDTDFEFNEVEFSEFLEEQNIIFLFKPHFVDSAVDIKITSPRFKQISDSDFDDLYILLSGVDAL